MKTTDEMKAAGFQIEETAFHSLAIRCPKCSGIRAVAISTRTPSEWQIRRVLDVLRENHGCTHTGAL